MIVIESGVCRRIVELLLGPNPNIVVPALRTVGNIVTGTYFRMFVCYFVL
jgi:importin subunit alpha-1